MSVQILHDRETDQAVMYCSTSMFGFGPVFGADHGHDAGERIQAFFRWLDSYTPPAGDTHALLNFYRHHDPRALTASGLEAAYLAWLRQEEQQYAAERAKEDEEELAS
jgi:hypothetical protein